MKHFPMAVSVSILLLTLAVPSPSNSQTTEDTARRSFVPSDPKMQAPSQVSTATAVPGVERKLSLEETGDLYMARKQYREASETYKQLTDQQPQNAVYLNKLGISLHQQEALSLALKYYQRAIKADPTYADAENNIGTVWYQRKKYGKAIKAYVRAIKIREDMPVLYSNLGYAYFADKKYEESINAFRTALSKDPMFFEHNSSRTGSILQDRTVSDRGRFYFLLAKSFAESGDIERCILYLRKAKDDNYSSFAAELKKDQAFALALKNPAVQELLAPKPTETPE
jgi:tetratricopeptide (TPR) repeat protein